MLFQEGDKVEWSSRACGFGTKKRATIAFVIPSGIAAKDFLRQKFGEELTEALALYSLSTLGVGGLGRNHVSYLVAIPKGPRAKPQLSWPIAAKLRKI